MEVTYRVSLNVTYITPSLPGIAQLSPSDQPAPLIRGAFFFHGITKQTATGAWAFVHCISHADAGPAMAGASLTPQDIIKQVQQSRRQSV